LTRQPPRLKKKKKRNLLVDGGEGRENPDPHILRGWSCSILQVTLDHLSTKKGRSRSSGLLKKKHAPCVCAGKRKKNLPPERKKKEKKGEKSEIGLKEGGGVSRVS